LLLVIFVTLISFNQVIRHQDLAAPFFGVF
jgi:hypothetical protein